MRREQAIYLFGAMAAASVGYIAWSARIFYIHPDVEFKPDVTPDARMAVASWMSAHPDFFLFPFDWDRFAGELFNPYRDSLTPVVVTHHYYSNVSRPSELVVYRKGHRKVLHFWLSDETWVRPSIH